MIDLGERTLRIIDIPGHTPGSIAILDEQYRVLISGDSVEDGNVFIFGKYRDLNLYIESMNHIMWIERSRWIRQTVPQGRLYHISDEENRNNYSV